MSLGSKSALNVYCIFEFNYCVGDIKNSDLGERIVCLGEGSGGREVGVRGEGSGEKGAGSRGKGE